MSGDAGPRRAERLRSVLAYAQVLMLEATRGVALLDARAVEASGSLLVVAPAGWEAAGLPAPATVHAALTIPVAVAERAFDPVTVHGRIALVPAAGLAEARTALAKACRTRLSETPQLDSAIIVRFEVLEASLAGVRVGLDEYRSAEVDPVAAESDEFVAHLVEEQPGQVAQLTQLLDPSLVRAAEALAPVRVDRHGVTFRVVTDRGAVDARLEFPVMLQNPAQLPAAVHLLERRVA